MTIPCSKAFLITAFFTLPTTAITQETLSSPSGEVRIVGPDMDMKSVAVGDVTLPLDDLRAALLDRVGNLILVATYSGGTACPAQYVWLDTTPGAVRLSESFGTCSDLAEVSSDTETVTVTMPSYDASEGQVAFVYDGNEIERRVVGLASSAIAQAAEGNPDAWIGESPYEYLTAAELEPPLIADIGWEQLDELRNTLVIGSQEMAAEGNWIVGSGCMPHRCDTDFAAIALHRESGRFIAAIKRDGAAATLIGLPEESLPPRLREVMTAR